MSEQRNPKYWASQWYSTKLDKEPWPGGWYWHDERYTWFGPYADENEAQIALLSYETSRSEEADAHQHTHPKVSLTLYHHPMCTYAQKVLIALYEKEVEFDSKIVDLMDAEERARYREMYPMGKIPLLVLNHGPLIPESSIIIEYLDSLGEPRLISEDPDVARKTRFKDRLFDLYLSDSMQNLVAQSRKPESKQDSEEISAARHRLSAVYDFMENEIRQQTWMNGEAFSMSDCAAAAAFLNAPTVVPFHQYPNITAYWERLSRRPSVRRAREEASAYLASFNDGRARAS